MSSSERVKRLTPTPETIRRLFLLSGNQCAFPGCSHPIILEDGTYVGEICHICAAEKGGERFDETQTNEGRRHFDNLMLMCRDHHVLTNDEVHFTPNRMREMKAEHERRFKIGLATMLDSAAAIHIEGSNIILGGEGGRAPGAGGGGGGAIGKGAIAGRGGEGGRTLWHDHDKPLIESSNPMFPRHARQFIESLRESFGPTTGAGGGGQGAEGDGARGGNGGHGGDTVIGVMSVKPGTLSIEVGQGGLPATLPGQHSFPGGSSRIFDKQNTAIGPHASGGRRTRSASSYLPDGIREVTPTDVASGLKMPLLVPTQHVELPNGLLTLQGAAWDSAVILPPSKELVWNVVAVVQGVRTEDIGLYLGLFSPDGMEMACQAVVIPSAHRTYIVWRPLGAKFDIPGNWMLVAYSGDYVLAQFAVEIREAQNSVQMMEPPPNLGS
ncbi:HNH endonuclease signature motif containing protein [Hydrogenophaga sp. XSHU_21]